MFLIPLVFALLERDRITWLSHVKTGCADASDMRDRPQHEPRPGVGAIRVCSHEWPRACGAVRGWLGLLYLSYTG
jgi:hypothetical protein